MGLVMRTYWKIDWKQVGWIWAILEFAAFVNFMIVGGMSQRHPHGGGIIWRWHDTRALLILIGPVVIVALVGLTCIIVDEWCKHIAEHGPIIQRVKEPVTKDLRDIT